eukprot:g2562.t1
MGLEETLEVEERNEGHAAQLRRARAAYQSPSCDDRAIFEYGWVLTRADSKDYERKRAVVLEGVRVLKALEQENSAFRGFVLLAIAQAYFRLGDLNKSRVHTERLMQLYPKDDPERNANLRKAIDLHKAIVSKATDEGLHVMNVAFLVAVIGGLAALAFVTMRNRKVAR